MILAMYINDLATLATLVASTVYLGKEAYLAARMARRVGRRARGIVGQEFNIRRIQIDGHHL